MDSPEMVQIKETITHSDLHKTFILDTDIEAEAGQFCMLWIPGLDEKPMSFSGLNPPQVTVKKVGSFTGEMFQMKAGDWIGFRGPYGVGFEAVDGRCLVVGGGCGIAPLRPLKNMLDGEAVISSVTEEYLLFIEDFENLGFEVHACTDDGSRGYPGMAGEKVEELLEEKTYECIYSCGPEPMLRKIRELALENNIPCQLSLERYMKCGIGLCASCMLDSKRVCMEGPVFFGEELDETEFGEYTRDKCGCKKRVEDV